MPRQNLTRFQSLLQRAARKVGYDVFPRLEDHHYVPRLYGRTSNKQIDIREDPVFEKHARRVLDDRRTMLYYDRLYTLYQGVRNLARFGDREVTIVESGVYMGGSSFFMAAVAQDLGLKARIFSFDTFQGHSTTDLRTDDLQVTTTFTNTSYESVRDYLSAWPNVTVRQGRVQESAPTLVDGEVHLVHLDMDIYEPTIWGLEYLAPRLATGGTIVVDDYGHTTCPGAKRAVDEFAGKTADFYPLHLLTGQALLVKTGG